MTDQAAPAAPAAAPTPTAPQAAPAPAPSPAAPAEPLGEPGIAALQSEREARRQAEKALADANAKVQAFEDRDKTEAQKAADALAAANQRIAELEVAKTRATVAAAKGVPAELLAGSTQAELEASADALIAFKGDAPRGPIVPSQGTAPQTGPEQVDWLRASLQG